MPSGTADLAFSINETIKSHAQGRWKDTATLAASSSASAAIMSSELVKVECPSFHGTAASMQNGSNPFTQLADYLKTAENDTKSAVIAASLQAFHDAVTNEEATRQRQSYMTDTDGIGGIAVNRSEEVSEREAKATVAGALAGNPQAT